MLKKNFLGVAAMSTLAITLAGCDTTNSTSNTVQSHDQSQNNDNSNIEAVKNNNENSNKYIGFQLELPQIGEEIAIMDVKDYGKIYIRLFSDECPKTVENFKILAKKGYYNGTTFHRVIENFMIQGGDPKGDGTGGESAFGGTFEDEFNDYLFNITGALSMANRGPSTNGSQFFINNVDPTDEVYNGTSSNEEVVNLYKKCGGNSHLDGYHTVFGQVFHGMDTVNKISKVKVDESNDKPINTVSLNKIDIVAFDGETN